MDHDTARPLLPLYFDGELDRATSRLFEAHLDDCALCRDELVALDALRRSLRDDAPRHAAPATLRARIAASSAGPKHGSSVAPTRRASGRHTLARWRAAAALALAFVAGGAGMQLWHGGSAAEQAQRDLFAGHWRALAATSPVDVVSSDRHTVKPWFEGKVAQAPVVRDFADQGFPLAGGRIDYAGGARVPVLVYRHGQHLIDVYVLGNSAALPVPAAQNGYRIDVVHVGDQPAAVVSDLDATEFARFESLLAAH